MKDLRYRIHRTMIWFNLAFSRLTFSSSSSLFFLAFYCSAHKNKWTWRRRRNKKRLSKQTKQFFFNFSSMPCTTNQLTILPYVSQRIVIVYLFVLYLWSIFIQQNPAKVQKYFSYFHPTCWICECIYISFKV